jgi:hypothetical protein
VRDLADEHRLLAIDDHHALSALRRVGEIAA